jgi:hypothetical protein
MPGNCLKKLKMKQGDIRSRARDDLAATVWKDKLYVNMLTDMHQQRTVCAMNIGML